MPAPTTTKNSNDLDRDHVDSNERPLSSAVTRPVRFDVVTSIFEPGGPATSRGFVPVVSATTTHVSPSGNSPVTAPAGVVNSAQPRYSG